MSVSSFAVLVLVLIMYIFRFLLIILRLIQNNKQYAHIYHFILDGATCCNLLRDSFLGILEQK